MIGECDSGNSIGKKTKNQFFLRIAHHRQIDYFFAPHYFDHGLGFVQYPLIFQFPRSFGNMYTQIV